MALDEYVNVAMRVSLEKKVLQSRVIWAYFILRNL